MRTQRVAQTQYKKLRITTLLGRIEVEEQVFQEGTHQVRPVCRRLNLEAGGYSEGIQKTPRDLHPLCGAPMLGTHNLMAPTIALLRDARAAHLYRYVWV